MSKNMNSKQATAGITALLIVAIIVVVNFLVGGLGVGNARIDLTIVGGNAYTGSPTRKTRLEIGDGHIFQGPAVNLGHVIGKVALTGRTVTDDNYFVQELRIFAHLHINNRLVTHHNSNLFEAGVGKNKNGCR